MNRRRYRYPRILIATVVLFGLVMMSWTADPANRGSAIASSSCPDGTGYGGQLAVWASRSLTQAGHGCVVLVHSQGVEVFIFTGTNQTWTVPSGVTSVELHVVGAGGGGAIKDSGGSAGGDGGGGGYATGTLSVVPGDSYTIIVGEGGRHHCVDEDIPSLSLDQRRNFSYGGGAAGFGGIAWDCAWASGGGRSAVRTSTGTDDIITAGGGGGGGYSLGHGGAGGGLTGQDGAGGVFANSVGRGGTQSVGGAGATDGEDGYPGIKYAGGPAGVDTNSPAEGGGGGGGWYGGGAGGNNGGGGGGSSYVGAAGGLIGGSTNGGDRRTPGAVPPRNTGLPSISGTSCIGSTLTATTGTWSGATTKSFKWQSSTDGSLWSDIAGATSATHRIATNGYVRVVETGRNYFGTTSANSSSTALIVDTALSALNVSSGGLSPTFAADSFAFAVTVPHTDSSIRITPTTRDPSASVEVEGASVTSGTASSAIGLAVGSNTINVVVSGTGCATTTILTVSRLAAPVVTPVVQTTTTTTTTTIVAEPSATPPVAIGTGRSRQGIATQLPKTGGVGAEFFAGLLLTGVGGFALATSLLVARRRASFAQSGIDEFIGISDCDTVLICRE